MPIHDQSYRHFTGEREPRGHAWIVIATTGIRTIVRKRLFLGLLLLAWLPFLVGAIRIYVSTMTSGMGAGAAELIAVTPETFRNFFDYQSVFAFFVTIWVGAGLIANDKRANALQIYLSKPLTRTEYIGGKLAILFTFLLAVTWLPAMLLLILQMLFSGSFQFIRANVFLFASITLYGFLYVFVSAFAMLALSSLSNSSRYVGIMYAGAVLFTDAIGNTLVAVTGSTALAWLSLPGNLKQVGNIIFRMKPAYEDTPWILSLGIIVGLIACSLWILERRVRGVEVVT